MTDRIRSQAGSDSPLAGDGEKLAGVSIAGTAGLLLLTLVLWEVIVRALHTPVYLFPAPTVVAKAAAGHLSALFMDSWVTATEAILGFLAANVAGLAVAALLAYSQLANRVLLPWLIGFRAVPLVAVAPLLILWFGHGLVGKAVMAALIAFFPIVINAATGFAAVDPDAMNLMKTVRASWWTTFRLLRFPTALPHIFAALKISTTLAMVGAVVAELAGSDKGLGASILISSYQLDTPMVFVGIIAAALVGLLMYGAVAVAERLIIRWPTG